MIAVVKNEIMKEFEHFHKSMKVGKKLSYEHIMDMILFVEMCGELDNIEYIYSYLINNK